MNPGAELLFDEFATRHVRGEHPDARDYLERAGDERDALAVLLDGFLAAAPVQPPSAETLATFAELVPGDHETPPMLAARVRLGLPRSQIVRALMRWLGVAEQSEEKFARYYHELETGLLDPRGVQPVVWHHLAKFFGTGIRSLMLHPDEPPAAMVAAYYRRSDDILRSAEPQPALRTDAVGPQRDEVDMLFTAGA